MLFRELDFLLQVIVKIKSSKFMDSHQPEATRDLTVVGFAAVAVGRGRELSSRCLARSCHRLTRQCGSINDRYRGDCSYPAWQAAGTPSNRGRMSAAQRAELTLSTLSSHATL